MDSTLPHSPLKWTFWTNLVFKNKIFLPSPCPSELHPNLGDIVLGHFLPGSLCEQLSVSWAIHLPTFLLANVPRD